MGTKSSASAFITGFESDPGICTGDVNEGSDLCIIMVFSKGQHQLGYHTDNIHVVILDNPLEVNSIGQGN